MGEVLGPDSPASPSVDCSVGVGLTECEATATVGASSLSDDPATDEYIYVWKTARAWSGQCRELTPDAGRRELNHRTVPVPMTAPGRPPARPRASALVVIIIVFLAGVVLLGRGLVMGVPVVYGGSEEEAAMRARGLVELALGCGLLALLGIMVARMSDLGLGLAIVVMTVVTSILGFAWLGLTYFSAAGLAALALCGAAVAVMQYWSGSTRRGR